MARKARLHWHPEPKARESDGKVETHCTLWVPSTHVTDDADKLIAADNGCERCRYKSGFPDYVDLEPFATRMYRVASDLKALVSDETSGTVRMSRLKKIFSDNNIAL